jgi:hypothetical protein
LPSGGSTPLRASAFNDPKSVATVPLTGPRQDRRFVDGGNRNIHGYNIAIRRTIVGLEGKTVAAAELRCGRISVIAAGVHHHRGMGSPATRL